MSKRIKWWAIGFGIYLLISILLINFFLPLVFSEGLSGISIYNFIIPLLFSLPLFFYEQAAMVGFLSFLSIYYLLVKYLETSGFEIGIGWIIIHPILFLLIILGIIPSIFIAKHLRPHTKIKRVQMIMERNGFLIVLIIIGIISYLVWTFFLSHKPVF